MTDLWWGRAARTKAKEEAGPFDSAEVRFARDDNFCGGERANGECRFHSIGFTEGITKAARAMRAAFGVMDFFGKLPSDAVMPGAINCA
jgi:hypothetical protein